MSSPGNPVRFSDLRMREVDGMAPRGLAERAVAAIHPAYGPRSNGEPLDDVACYPLSG